MRLALAATLVLGSTAALAQAPPSRGDLVTHAATVRDLAAICDPAWGGVPRLEAIAYCQGFITAAGQYHALMHPAGGAVRPLFCPPEPRPSVAETGVDFARWARTTTIYSNEPALDGFLRWAQARYPCAPATGGRAGRLPR